MYVYNNMLAGEFHKLISCLKTFRVAQFIAETDELCSDAMSAFLLYNRKSKRKRQIRKCLHMISLFGSFIYYDAHVRQT